MPTHPIPLPFLKNPPGVKKYFALDPKLYYARAVALMLCDVLKDSGLKAWPVQERVFVGLGEGLVPVVVVEGCETGNPYFTNQFPAVIHLNSLWGNFTEEEIHNIFFRAMENN